MMKTLFSTHINRSDSTDIIFFATLKCDDKKSKGIIFGATVKNTFLSGPYPC